MNSYYYLDTVRNGLIRMGLFMDMGQLSMAVGCTGMGFVSKYLFPQIRFGNEENSFVVIFVTIYYY